MPFYSYECECGESMDIYKNKLESPPLPLCPCGSRMYRVYGVSIYTFKPIKTDQFTGKTIEISSRSQRDRLLKEHSLTMDSGRYVRKPRYRSPVRDITLGDVKREFERNRPEPLKEIEGLPPISGVSNSR